MEASRAADRPNGGLAPPAAGEGVRQQVLVTDTATPECLGGGSWHPTDLSLVAGQDGVTLALAWASANAFPSYTLADLLTTSEPALAGWRMLPLGSAGQSAWFEVSAVRHGQALCVSYWRPSALPGPLRLYCSVEGAPAQDCALVGDDGGAGPGAGLTAESTGADLTECHGSLRLAAARPDQEDGSLPSRIWVGQVRDPDTGLVSDTHTLGRGHSPAVEAAGDRLVAAWVNGERSPMPELSPGPILLCTSPDGKQWTQPVPTVREAKAQSLALAQDEEHGLILVYTADRRAGWPLFAARSMDNGETWGKPVMLTEPTVYAFRPDAMLHDGVLYVAYLGMPTPPTREGSASNLADPEGVYLLTVDPATLPVAEG